MPVLDARRSPYDIANSDFLLLAAFLLHASAASAFSEDLCVQDNADGSRSIVDCLTAETCGPNAEDHTHCRANITYDAAKAVGNGRSIVHTDSTYFIAQALVTPLLLFRRTVVWKGREYQS